MASNVFRFDECNRQPGADHPPIRDLVDEGIVSLAVAVGGCNLDVENPNAPDAKRAFLDPSGLQQLEGGAFRTWVETRGDFFGAMPMTAMTMAIR